MTMPSTNPTLGRQDSPKLRKASINVGKITFDDQAANFRDDDPSGSVYTNYFVENVFENDLHRYMAGVTSPQGFQGNSVALFQLASPTLLWIANWTASRLGQKPKLPDPEPADSSWVLLDKMFGFPAITVGPNGVTPVYHAKGTYFYAKKNPSEQTMLDLFYPLAPWIKVGVYPANLSSSDLDGRILNPGTSINLYPGIIPKPQGG